MIGNDDPGAANRLDPYEITCLDDGVGWGKVTRLDRSGFARHRDLEGQSLDLAVRIGSEGHLDGDFRMIP